MKIMVRRWIDDPGDTIIIANIKHNAGPIANEWAVEASREGADSALTGTDKGMVITFSKGENLYSHNTTLSAKEINNILKLDKVTILEESETVLIYT